MELLQVLPWASWAHLSAPGYCHNSAFISAAEFSPAVISATIGALLLLLILRLVHRGGRWSGEIPFCRSV